MVAFDSSARISHILPVVTCSSCSAQVELSLMGDHVCAKLPPKHVFENLRSDNKYRQQPYVPSSTFDSYNSSNAYTPPNGRIPFSYNQQHTDSHYNSRPKENFQISNHHPNPQTENSRFSNKSSTSSILKQDPRFPAPQRSIHDLIQQRLPGNKWELAPPNEYDRATEDSDDDIAYTSRRLAHHQKPRGPSAPKYMENDLGNDSYNSSIPQNAYRPRTADQHRGPIPPQTSGRPPPPRDPYDHYGQPPSQGYGRPPPQQGYSRGYEQRPMNLEGRRDVGYRKGSLSNGQSRDSNNSSMSYRSEGQGRPLESASRVGGGYMCRPAPRNEMSDQRLMEWAHRDEAARRQNSSRSTQRTAEIPLHYRGFPSRAHHEYKKYSRGSSVTSGSGSLASDYLANSSAASSPPVSDVSSSAPREKLQQSSNHVFRNILEDVESQMAKLQPSPFRSNQTSISSKKSTDTHCRACGNVVEGKGLTSSDGKLSGKYHKQCFRCVACQATFPNFEFYVYKDNPYCSLDYHRLNGSLCRTCGQGIEGTCLQIENGDRHHPKCFTCAECNSTLDQGYFEIGGRPYCERHAMRMAKSDMKLNVHMERRRTRIMVM